MLYNFCIESFIVSLIFFFIILQKPKKGAFDPPKGGVCIISRDASNSYMKEHIKTPLSTKAHAFITMCTIRPKIPHFRPDYNTKQINRLDKNF